MNLRASVLFKKRETSQALKALFAGTGKRVIRFSVAISGRDEGGPEETRRRLGLALDLTPIAALPGHRSTSAKK